MSQTQSEVSAYRTVHGIKGYRYLSTLTLDLYAHYLNVNGGLPMFLPGYYLGKITEKIVQDTLGEEDSDAVLYFEKLTGLGRESVLERADAGQALDFDSFLEEEMDETVSALLEEQKEWFIEDVHRILDDERITFFLPENEDDLVEMTFKATNGELTLFAPTRSRVTQPYKGGGFSCSN